MTLKNHVFELFPKNTLDKDGEKTEHQNNGHYMTFPSISGAFRKNFLLLKSKDEDLTYGALTAAFPSGDCNNLEIKKTLQLSPITRPSSDSCDQLNPWAVEMASLENV